MHLGELSDEKTMHSSALVIGFDFGLRRIGVAVGNCLTKHANPLPTIFANKGEPNWREINAIIKTWHPVACVVGLPININGTEQYITQAARQFAQKLESEINLNSQAKSMPVYMVDERLSTIEARSQLFTEGGYKKIKNQEVDSIAACVILQQWLSSS